MTKLIAIFLISLSCFGGVDFNGSSDYISLGTMGDFGDNLDQHSTTISIWFKTTTTTSMSLCGQGNNTGNDTDLHIDINRTFATGVNATGYILMRLRDEDAANRAIEYGADSGITDGSWHNLVLIIYITTNFKIYLDGIQLTSNITNFNNGNPDNTANFTGVFTVGALNWKGTIGVDGWFDGVIGDFNIYNRALTSDEISLLYNSGQKRMPLQIDTQEVILPLDDHPDGASTDTLVFKDLSGNGNDGTATGGTAVAEQVLSYPAN